MGVPPFLNRFRHPFRIPTFSSENHTNEPYFKLPFTTKAEQFSGSVCGRELQQPFAGTGGGAGDGGGGGIGLQRCCHTHTAARSKKQQPSKVIKLSRRITSHVPKRQ